MDKALKKLNEEKNIINSDIDMIRNDDDNCGILVNNDFNDQEWYKNQWELKKESGQHFHK